MGSCRVFGSGMCLVGSIQKRYHNSTCVSSSLLPDAVDIVLLGAQPAIHLAMIELAPAAVVGVIRIGIGASDEILQAVSAMAYSAPIHIRQSGLPPARARQPPQD